MCYAPCSCALTPAGLWLASWKLRQADAKSQHQRVLRQHKVVLEELGALRKEQAQLQEEVVEHTKEVQASEATVRSTEAAIATCSAELEADTAAYAKLKDQADRDLERKGELTEQRDELQRVLRTAKDARRRNDNEERKREALADMKRSAASLACEDASSTCVARHPSGSQTPSHGCWGSMRTPSSSTRRPRGLSA